MTAPPQSIRNVGVMAHVDAGKTTLSECILFNAGVVSAMGEVADGTAVTDHLVEEQERGISIVAAAAWCSWRGTTVNLIDTPGHVDFSIEVERSLRIVDGAIAVISAVEGVQAQTEAVWRQADAHGLPRICFINKMDREGADLERVLGEIRDRLHARPLLVQWPSGAEGGPEGVYDLVGLQHCPWSAELDAVTRGADPMHLPPAAAARRGAILDVLGELDDEVVRCFVEMEAVPEAVLQRAIRAATLRGEVVPVLCGSAARNEGVHLLLDAVVAWLPSPGPARRSAGEGREPAGLRPDLQAFVFKVQRGGDAQTLHFTRVYAGTMRDGDVVHLLRVGARAVVGEIGRMTGADWQHVGWASPGDIVAIAGLDGVASGETLSERPDAVALEPLLAPAPVMSVAIEAQSEEEADAFAAAATSLAADDPTLRIGVDEESGRLLIHGMGELQVEVLVAQAARATGVSVRMGRPQVAIRECVSRRARAFREVRRLVGGRGEEAAVEVEVHPAVANAGSGVDLGDVRVGLDGAQAAAVRQGLQDALERGVLAPPSPVVDVQVRVLACHTHATDTTPGALRQAAFLALSDALAAAEAHRVEPQVAVEVHCPPDHVGAVLKDLTARRAIVRDLATSPHGQVIRAALRLADMFGYASDLRSVSQGRASFSMHFERYARVPVTFRKDVVARTGTH